MKTRRAAKDEKYPSGKKLLLLDQFSGDMLD